ncbi:MAG: hypothetical protein Ct9H300mP21_04610 [Pseudomonadota bacterium]|nr:MAG: hypothetical protein Ct9H300mP21_04610 [Pseudomonadota bacterium]
MEQGTLVGTILAWFMLLFAMMFDFSTLSLNIGNGVYFWDTPSLMIVFGGTVASTFISHPMGDAKGFLGYIGKSWKPNSVQLVETLTLIIDVSKIARKNILAIEDALPSIENLFLRGGLRLVVDRADREAIVNMMAHEVKYTMAGRIMRLLLLVLWLHSVLHGGCLERWLDWCCFYRTLMILPRLALQWLWL